MIMNTLEIICLIIVTCFFVVYIIIDELCPKQKIGDSPEEKLEKVITELFHDCTSLNCDALDAYKALIQASFEESQTHRQDGPRRR